MRGLTSAGTGVTGVDIPDPPLVAALAGPLYALRTALGSGASVPAAAISGALGDAAAHIGGTEDAHRAGIAAVESTAIGSAADAAVPVMRAAAADVIALHDRTGTYLDLLAAAHTTTSIARARMDRIIAEFRSDANGMMFVASALSDTDAVIDRGALALREALVVITAARTELDDHGRRLDAVITPVTEAATAAEPDTSSLGAGAAASPAMTKLAEAQVQIAALQAAVQLGTSALNAAVQAGTGLVERVAEAVGYGVEEGLPAVLGLPPQDGTGPDQAGDQPGQGDQSTAEGDASAPSSDADADADADAGAGADGGADGDDRLPTPEVGRGAESEPPPVADEGDDSVPAPDAGPGDVPVPSPDAGGGPDQPSASPPPEPLAPPYDSLPPPPANPPLAGLGVEEPPPPPGTVAPSPEVVAPSPEVVAPPPSPEVVAPSPSPDVVPPPPGVQMPRRGQLGVTVIPVGQQISADAVDTVLATGPFPADLSADE
ncbi:hypothetical protein [Nocardia wallacei]|uniref:hypothetical protein n=1 Tax=Nocardia wallacei TaxID=480035 RepID=UPI002453A99B|nr:hypothetical protein [Nocardia wallacei]